jgi:hypothetical protein
MDADSDGGQDVGGSDSGSELSEEEAGIDDEHISADIASKSFLSGCFVYMHLARERGCEFAPCVQVPGPFSLHPPYNHRAATAAVAHLAGEEEVEEQGADSNGTGASGGWGTVNMTPPCVRCVWSGPAQAGAPTSSARHSRAQCRLPTCASACAIFEPVCINLPLLLLRTLQMGRRRSRVLTATALEHQVGGA